MILTVLERAHLHDRRARSLASRRLCRDEDVIDGVGREVVNRVRGTRWLQRDVLLAVSVRTVVVQLVAADVAVRVLRRVPRESDLVRGRRLALQVRRLLWNCEGRKWGLRPCVDHGNDCSIVICKASSVARQSEIIWQIQTRFKFPLFYSVSAGTKTVNDDVIRRRPQLVSYSLPLKPYVASHSHGFKRYTIVRLMNSTWEISRETFDTNDGAQASLPACQSP